MSATSPISARLWVTCQIGLAWIPCLCIPGWWQSWIISSVESSNTSLLRTPLRNPAAWLTTPHTFELLFLDFLLAFKRNLGKQCQGPMWVSCRRHNIPCWCGSGVTNMPMGTVQVSAQRSRQCDPMGKPQIQAQNLVLRSRSLIRHCQDVFSWLLWDLAKEVHGIWHLE